MPKDCLHAGNEIKPRIILYSHDTLGFGHLRRNLTLARRLREMPERPDVLMIAGMREAGAFEVPEGVDLVTLPAYAKESCGTYRARHLGLGLQQLAALRAEMIKATVRSFRPDLMIVDNVPRGAQEELCPALDWLRDRTSARIVLGLRDVIDSRDAVRRQWLRQRNFEALNRYYDEIWVYGDPAFYDLVEEYRLGASLGEKVRFTGYLDRAGQPDMATARRVRQAVLGEDRSPYILCALGGGRDGLTLGAAFAAARMPEGRRGILVTGSQMPVDDRQRIAVAADTNPDLTVIDFVPELTGLLNGAERVVGMGGYNTVCEVLSYRKTALIVPRDRPRQEQLIRAERLAAARLIDMMQPAQVSPSALSDWLARPTDAGRGRNTPDLGGLDRFAAFAAEALAPSQALRLVA